MRSECTHDLRKAGHAYPRTCAECGLGPCKWYDNHGHPLPSNDTAKVQAVLDAMVELGLIAFPIQFTCSCGKQFTIKGKSNIEGRE